MPYLKAHESAPHPVKAFVPARRHVDGQLGVRQRLLILLQLLEAEGAIAKQPGTNRGTVRTVSDHNNDDELRRFGLVR